MAECRFTPPTMDWTGPGDVHKRFKLFKQKCGLIFEGPLEKTSEEKKVRLLLLWVGDKGLEIYNTATWTTDGDDLKLKPVLQNLEAYTRPQSNHILARFQLRSLKQGDMPLEEFITKARVLIDDGGYDARFKDETLRDTLVFGIKSDKPRKDAIALGNSLTFKQVYDLAKTEESAREQMKIITGNQSDGLVNETHAVRLHRKPAQNLRPNVNTTQRRQESNYQSQAQKAPDSFKPRKFDFKFNGCFRCGNNHEKSATCPAINQKCKYCGKMGHFLKVCMKKRTKEVHQIVDSPDYQGQDIYLPIQDCQDTPSHTYSYQEDEASDSETVSVFVGTLTSEQSINSIENHINRIYANVKLNDQHEIRMKVDTGADTCVLTTDDLQDMPFPVNIKPSNSILKGYGGSQIPNLGVVNLKTTVQDKSLNIPFNIVDAPGSPSMIGCKQSQDLGIVTVKVHGVNTPEAQTPTLKPPVIQLAANEGKLTKSSVLEEYKDCFDKIGRFPGEKYHIQLSDNPKPVVHPPRTVPVHILPLYKAELDKMIEDDIITEVTGPTDWVNSIVCNITTTHDGKTKVRLCLDPKDLNNSIRREHYYSRTIDEILPLLHGMKYFSVADTKKGYYHVELDYESSLLCTFNTPFGRYMFRRLPFGVKVSQDVFQRKLDNVYKDIPNVTGIADDILIAGSTREEHDQACVNMLEATRRNNIGLNSEKLQFKQQTVNFYGHTLTPEGIQPSSSKLETIRNIQAPTNVKELLTILGMITYLNRYSTKLAELTAPLRELTKKHVHFRWECRHQQALDRIKAELCTSKILSYYDPNPTTVTILQCDASQEGLGAWIRQMDPQNQERIIAMASRSLTETEKRYSNIERECLAVMYGLEKFEYYLLGRHTLVETDHSPLEQIFKKNISEAPGRLQRLLLRCLRFDVEVKYKPGKSIPVADALSRMCFEKRKNLTENHPDYSDYVPDYDIHFVTGITCPIDINLIKAETDSDPIMTKLKDTIYNGWPDHKKECPPELQSYWNFRCDLVLEDGLVLKGDKILVPKALRKQVLNVIHIGHQGETKCILLARGAVFWPGVTNDIQEMVRNCNICNKYQPAQPKLPAMQPDLPTRPWEKLGTDIFEFNGSKYLMIVDYYSRFPVIRLLKDISANTICTHFTSVIAEYGLPSTINADCGSQYISEKFKKQCELSGISITYSSPYHHQTNSLAERAIGTCKSLLKKALDDKQCPYTALWMYRITPLDNQMPSPYELLYGRKPRQILPRSRASLQSKHPDNDKHLEANQQRQDRQADSYNNTAGNDRRPLYNREPVYVHNTLKRVWERGTVLNRPNPIREPRTYMVDMGGRLYQRTREHLRPREISGGSATPPPDRPITLTTNQPSAFPDTANKTGTIPAADGPSTPAPPTPSGTEQPLLYSQTTRYGRTTKVPERFRD